jgi:hypothetical protein
MASITTELKQLVGRHLDAASPSDLLEILGQLCHAEEPVRFSFSPSSTEQPRYARSGATIQDASTGLTWSVDDIGERHTWAEAKKTVTALSLGGFTDWRLPTIKELLTLVDYDRSSPSIDPIFSTCKADWYWSSTPYHSSPGGYAWSVYFSSGGSSNDSQSREGLVRAVRSRQ